MLQAQAIYRRPGHEIRAVFIGRGNLGEECVRIGRRDFWDCWFATKADLERVFERRAADDTVTAPVRVNRMIDKLAALKARAPEAARG